MRMDLKRIFDAKALVAMVFAVCGAWVTTPALAAEP